MFKFQVSQIWIHPCLRQLYCLSLYRLFARTSGFIPELNYFFKLYKEMAKEGNPRFLHLKKLSLFIYRLLFSFASNPQCTTELVAEV